MQRKSSLNLTSRIITLSTLILVIFGSLMIVSAEMGNSVGDTSNLTRTIIKQTVFIIIGIAAYFFFLKVDIYRIRKSIFKFFFIVLLFALFACRLFGETNGAYAWIRVGSLFTIQPSEFAKAFIILYGGISLSRDNKEKNYNAIIEFWIMLVMFSGIIVLVQHDLGSGFVLFVIGYCMLMIPPFKEYKTMQKVMTYVMLGIIAFVMFTFSKPFNNFLMKYSDDYRVARFLAAENPFIYRYDNGYHVIMALVSFANGNIFGLGYGNSIHKYMNFPNPSNDFILPVIVEELGIIGFIFLIVLYGCLLTSIIYYSFKSKYLSTKIIMMGTFTYFIAHFILNVGGVCAFIPLTGVPLLLISSGGSSLVASLMCLGFVQNQIIRNTKYENNGGK